MHTLNLWMREDGVEVDCFILTKDAAFNPNTFDECGGRVDFQAECFTGQAPGTGNAANHTWSQISDAAAGGGLALQAAPNSGVNTGDVTNGPRRDFAINFANAGTYYVWVRSSGATGANDHCTSVLTAPCAPAARWVWAVSAAGPGATPWATAPG